jgi:uncharacterized protein YjbI with pentapeptide repeats
LQREFEANGMYISQDTSVVPEDNNTKYVIFDDGKRKLRISKEQKKLNVYSDAILKNAHLEHANLRDACLTNSNMSSVFLEHADLTDANLAGADLTDANMVNATLPGADLIEAVLTDAILEVELI